MNNRNSFIGNIVSIGLLALFLIFTFFILRTIFVFIYKFSFIFLIISLILNYRVARDYIKSLFELIKREPVYGFGGIALSVIFHPVVFLVWMFRAAMSRTLGNVTQERNNPYFGQERNEDYTDYEIIQEEMELKEMEKRYRED